MRRRILFATLMTAGLVMGQGGILASRAGASGGQPSCFANNEWTVGGVGAFSAVSQGTGVGAAEFSDASHGDTDLPGDWQVTWQVTENVTGNAGPINTMSAGAMNGVLQLDIRHLGSTEHYVYQSTCIHEGGIDEGGIEAEFGGRSNYPNSRAFSPTVGSIVVTHNDVGSLKVQTTVNVGTPITGEGPVELNVTIDATSKGMVSVPPGITEAGRVALPTGCKVIPGPVGSTDWTDTCSPPGD